MLQASGSAAARSIPPIVARDGTPSIASHDVVDEQDSPEHEQECTETRDQVPGIPPHVVRIRVDPPRHSLETEDVHGEERHVEADEQQPEGDLAQAVVHHPADDLRIPEIDAADQWKDRAAQQHVVEVRHDVVRVVDLEIERDRCQRHA